MTPEFFIFSWQKANGDEYKIPVKNNLDINIEQQKVNRVLMQILLKSLIRSKDFEFFNPIGFTLIPDEKNMVAQLIFNKVWLTAKQRNLLIILSLTLMEYIRY